jgi:uncharacterized protein YdiU (UPF0061 family)
MKLLPAAFEALGETFFTRLHPTPMPAPYWVSCNPVLANDLGLPTDWSQDTESLALCVGNAVSTTAHPLATVYSGHQFGHWAGQLGDGRAILLGDMDTPQGRQEVQLKGAGLTPYSRTGDGRAVLRSSIREYLCSEAMHGLGIPTTRALCVAGSDQAIRREDIETAAVVTRTAPSFIRFGHFEHFAYRQQYPALKRLADFVIDHHYPECRHPTTLQGNPYAALLQAVSERTAQLVAQWQAVGFCHGVMNTDNMSILGLTIDYGPFQFLDAFDPGHICNHSDNQGRYAYNKQPNIAYWNLFCLGQALLPLINGLADGADETQANDQQALALAALESYKTVFPAALERLMLAKLGFPATPAATSPEAAAVRALIETLLKRLAQDRVDYTIFWRRLSHHVHEVTQGRAMLTQAAEVRDLFLDRDGFQDWLLQYSEQLSPVMHAETGLNMLKTNPQYVLRNHLGEQAIRAAKLKDFSETDRLLALLQSPFDDIPGAQAYAGFPPDWAASIEISCSS